MKQVILVLLLAVVWPAWAVELHRATVVGDLEKMTALLDAGADPNERDSRGMTPLLIAVAMGRQDATDLLLTRGGNPFNPLAKQDLPALAEKFRHDDLARWLRQRMKAMAAAEAGQDFTLRFRQDDRDVPVDRGVVALKPGPFEIWVRLPKSKLVSVNASRTAEGYETAVMNQSLDKIFAFKGKAMAGMQANANEDVLIDPEAYQAWFYVNDQSHRCNAVSEIETGVICVRKVSRVWEKGQAIPITEVPELFLVVISARDASRLDQVEAQRQAFHLQFR